MSLYIFLCLEIDFELILGKHLLKSFIVEYFSCFSFRFEHSFVLLIHYFFSSFLNDDPVGLIPVRLFSVEFFHWLLGLSHSLVQANLHQVTMEILPHNAFLYQHPDIDSLHFVLSDELQLLVDSNALSLHFLSHPFDPLCPPGCYPHSRDKPHSALLPLSRNQHHPSALDCLQPVNASLRLPFAPHFSLAP